jgi:hypothetical protein
LLDQVRALNWDEFDTPDGYRPAEVITALEQLIHLDAEDDLWPTYNATLSAIGNNHGGVYYEAVLGALPLIVALALDPPHALSQRCCVEIMADWLTSFEAELGNQPTTTTTALEDNVRTTIRACLPHIKPQSTAVATLLSDLADHDLLGRSLS